MPTSPFAREMIAPKEEKKFNSFNSVTTLWTLITSVQNVSAMMHQSLKQMNVAIKEPSSAEAVSVNQDSKVISAHPFLAFKLPCDILRHLNSLLAFIFLLKILSFREVLRVRSRKNHPKKWLYVPFWRRMFKQRKVLMRTMQLQHETIEIHWKMLPG